VKAPVQIQFLFEYRDQYVNAHGNPDLRFDRVGRCTEKAFDPEILFDPLEEEFDLPAAFVEQGNSQRRQCKVVCQVYKEALRLEIEIPDAAQPIWISFLTVEDFQTNDLIGAHPRRGIHLLRLHSHILQGAFGSNNEESAKILERMKALEIQISPVHDIKGPRLDGNQIEGMDVVQLAIADMDEAGYGAPQIQQRMQLDGPFGPSKLGPTKQIQTQVDSRGVECVGRASRSTAKGSLVYKRRALRISV